MELSIDNAKAALANPPPELRSMLANDGTPQAAKDALAEVMKGSATGSVINGNKGTSGENDRNSPGDGRLQVVDEEQRFSPELSKYLAKWGILDKGFAYDVVAVFGSQSTGKSTLLNRLFGTSFDVMDESKRQQTTKGIWMCPSSFSSTIVMDVEGTDGRERGEDQDFERKSALFSLASTEVLLVNLWEHQIGLYQGANMGLLKTVFEVNLGLFGGSPSSTSASGAAPSREKTLLLFVIRDYVGHTPLENLTNTLTKDMEKIWSSLSKPEHLSNATIYDYFDLSFSALPHKILAPEKFESAVLDLRKRFTDRQREDYVFKPGYHKRIPADGVSHYMESIWEQVLTNKDLDLPTQQELLAQFRCDEIAAVVVEAFLAASKGVRRPVESGMVVEGLGGMLGDWRSTALAKFDRDASRYHPSVYARKRADLLVTLHTSLSPLVLGQLKNLHKRGVVTFRSSLLAKLKGDSYDFGTVVVEVSKQVEDEFISAAKELILKDTDWQYDDELLSLKDDLRLIADQLRADETKKMVNAIERNLKRQLAEPVEVTLSRPRPDMWDNLMIMFKTTLEKAEENYMAKARSFNCTDEENVTSLDSIRRRAWRNFRAKVDEQLSDVAILAKLRAHFEEKFRYDDAGVPKVWKPEDDIDGAFKMAKQDALDLIPLYATIKTTNPAASFDLPPEASPDTTLDLDSDLDYDASLIIFSETKKLDLENRFRRDADAYYVEAKRSMVSSIAQIPVWMYGALVVLGWNEAMTVLFNPLYAAMLLVLGATAYIVLQLGLLGPILQVTRTVGNEIHRIAMDKLREAFRDIQPQLEAPHRNTSDVSEREREKERRRMTGDGVGEMVEK